MKKALKWIGIVLLVILVVGAAGVIFLTVKEYRPADVEQVDVQPGIRTAARCEEGQSFRVMTFNIGYGALGAEQDFFMDGGSRIRPDSGEVVEGYLSGIQGILTREKADVVFLQEVDKKAKRSYGIDELSVLTGGVEWEEYSVAFAKNFDAVYIPYPLPETIGQVTAGLALLNRFETEEARRISLPTPFTWPMRVCQLKRCLLVERVPLQDSDRELVLVNLHLEAYDDGSGKAAQTEILMNFLEEEYAKGNYCIAGGDFNQCFETTDTSAYPLLNTDYFEAGIIKEDQLPEGFSFVADSGVPSARLLNKPYDPKSSDTQYYMLDGFIVSDNVAVEEIRTLDEGFAYSDHNPVVLSATLKAK